MNLVEDEEQDVFGDGVGFSDETEFNGYKEIVDELLEIKMVLKSIIIFKYFRMTFRENEERLNEMVNGLI